MSYIHIDRRSAQLYVFARARIHTYTCMDVRVPRTRHQTPVAGLAYHVVFASGFSRRHRNMARPRSLACSLSPLYMYLVHPSRVLSLSLSRWERQHDHMIRSIMTPPGCGQAPKRAYAVSVFPAAHSRAGVGQQQTGTPDSKLRVHKTRRVMFHHRQVCTPNSERAARSFKHNNARHVQQRMAKAAPQCVSQLQAHENTVLSLTRGAPPNHPNNTQQNEIVPNDIILEGPRATHISYACTRDNRARPHALTCSSSGRTFCRKAARAPRRRTRGASAPYGLARAA